VLRYVVVVLVIMVMMFRVFTPPGKSGKVLDFFPEIFGTSKVLEYEFGPGKSWKFKLMVLKSPYFLIFL